MASRAALGKPERIVYGATKAGLIGLTRTLAQELGGDGITVNAVAPEDVARAALFFLSPDNGFVTGQVLYVCGGTTLGVAPV